MSRGPRGAGAEAATPRLSVITASRGRPELLRDKALAMAGQTLEPEAFEWCLWLNEDVAETARLERMLRACDLPFALHVSGGEELPVGAARNRAAGLARGSVLLLCDDDCVPDPRALERHLRFHRETPRAVGIGTLRLPDGLRSGRLREPFERPARLGRLASWINFTGANSSVPARAYREVGGYDDGWSGYGGEDPELALRLRAAGLRFRHVPEAVAHHHGRVWSDEDKAYRAGRAHRRVVERHPGWTTAWALGVHPALLAAKRVVLNGPWSALLDDEVLRYERAYARGARDAARGRHARGAPAEDPT